MQQVLRSSPDLPAEKVAEKVFEFQVKQFLVQQPDAGDAAGQSAHLVPPFAAARRFHALAAVLPFAFSVVHRHKKLWAAPEELSAAPA